MISMQDSHRSIYRDKALTHYWKRKDTPILPHFFTYHTNVYVFLLALLLCSFWFLWYARMPIYIEGSAIIISGDRSIDRHEEPTIVVLFSPEYLNRVRIGHDLFLQNNPAGDRIQSSITDVESQMSNPTALQQRFHLKESAVLALPNPSAVAIAPFSMTADVSPVSSDGSALYRVDIEVGSRRIGSFLPIIGQWLDDTP